MLLGGSRRVALTILLLTICQRVASSDSEVVEAMANYDTMPQTVAAKWTTNESVLVKPYNILEAGCPPGYVLANKHCHKRVREADAKE